MENERKKLPLVLLCGPTAVGKTKLSIDLAKAINGEIISADSMQVYKYMDIGSAKITEEEKEGIRHHLIDILDPHDEFSVADFKNYAKKCAEDIASRGKIPIVVGGTGFYVQALIYDIDFESGEGANTSLRKQLENIAKEKGPEVLYEMLKERDPESCSYIHMNNIKKVIRAIEYFEETGSPISAHNEEMHQRDSIYNFAYFVLNDDREKVYDNIDKRVDIMLDSGLLEEVTKLKDMGLTRDYVSMHGLGYKEILEYLEGDIPLEEAVYKIKRDTRHFAKRQITWFKREKEVIWLNKPSFAYNNEAIISYIKETLNDKGIL